MKNILSILAAVALLFTACEPATETPGAESQQIKLTSNETIKVGSGSAMAFLTYEILESVEGASVNATADVNWIVNFDYKQQGKINFTVEKNPNGEPREGVITVTYDKSKFEVKVIQSLSEQPTNKVINMPILQGKYYGYTQGLYNYYLAFSDLGMDANHMFKTPNAHFYFVDLYLDTTPSDMDNIVVPNGTYEFDKSNAGFANTFTDSFSWYQINDESGFASENNQMHFDKGSITIEDGKVTLEVTLEVNHMQETHKVVYEGDYYLIDCTNENM